MGRVKADQKGLAFSFTVSANLPSMVGVDETRLRQILLNLLDNAVKFTDRGKIELHVAPASGAQGFLTREHKAPNRCLLHFAVQDTGIGMTEPETARIFLPFEQTAGVERREGGAGLGLAISEQLVRLMGSDGIQLQTKAGEGSCFWFDLDVPIAANSVPAMASRLITGYMGPRKTILVVDDVRQNRIVFTRLLSSVGFVAMEAENGRLALESIARTSPDLIIMDIMMPVMDGVEVIRRIRLDLAPKTVIIAVSASACPDNRLRSLQAGANAFLTKPVDLDGLLVEIGERLGLTWLEEGTAGANFPTGSGVEIVAPPAADMAVLHRLALEGDMRGIRREAERVATLDPRYALFTERLRLLAEEYQTRAIVEFIDRHMNRGGSPG